MAAIENRVTVKKHEVTKVTPFVNPNSKTTSFTLHLTYFDFFWFKNPPVERLFFYEMTDLTWDLFNSEVLPKLKHSLSLTLLHYLPLAGHITWPLDAAKPAVYYFPDQNDGVSFAVAEWSSESHAGFHHLSGNEIRQAVEFHPLVPQLSITDDKAEVIAIQITLFPNQGFSIGVSSHHAILDGKTSTFFLKSWAYLCKQLQLCHHPCLSPELTPLLDRTVIKDPTGQDTLQLNKWVVGSDNSDPQKIRSLKVLPFLDSESLNKFVRATFQLTREDITKLRHKVNHQLSKSSKSKQVHLSTFVLTLAYVFVCMAKAKLAKAKTEAEAAAGNDEIKNIVVGFTADYRSRLDPPIPLNYFGNCNGRHCETAKASDFVQENGVAFVAEMLSDMVKGIDADAIEANDDEVSEILEILKEGAIIFSVAGSTQFDVYGSDFGWGRPKKVEIVSIDRTQAISLAERRDGGGGVEVGVVLEKQQMEVFESLFADGLKSDLV
ncbi:hypothetical protein CUMW_115780 [Citrus unshiu]|uniref:Uncharacterized protein n=1 Tax=Citrus unshiu TaxID=55188 RepID=A0A2H5P9I0_CITUN|nr:hypothetical protein CUMW_115780 [Citrus unshiu]